MSKFDTNTIIDENENSQTIGLFSSYSDTDHEKPLENHYTFKSIMPLFSTVVTATVTSDMALPCVKKDPGGIGFLDEVGGSVNGLLSCTESLGFESSDERRVVDDNLDDIDRKWEQFPRRVSRTTVKAEVKKFPPPLSSLNDDGKPNFFLRPMRKDGRLELTEVEIERPEILRASREDGRLRLDLITELEDDEDEDVEDEEEIIESFVDEKEEEKDERWEFPVITCDRRRFRRCHEVVTGQHRHNDMHGWRQLCVVIR